MIAIAPANSEVHEGTTLLMACLAFGDTLPIVSWTRNGSTLSNYSSNRITVYQERVEEGGVVFAQSVLEICRAEESDAGLYSCVATTQGGQQVYDFQITIETGGSEYFFSFLMPPRIILFIVFSSSGWYCSSCSTKCLHHCWQHWSLYMCGSGCASPLYLLDQS